MIHFEGDRRFPHPVAVVSAKLGDASFLVSCINDAQVISATPDRAVWKMRPAFSFIRTTLETTLDVLDRVPEQLTKVRLASSGIGATSSVEITLTYQERDGGTDIHWEADVVQLTGLLKLVPRGLIQSAANKVVEETWAGVEKQLNT